MFCREHVVQLRHEEPRIRAAGGHLVVVGSGTPNFVAGFREITGFTGTILTDPQLTAYRAASLRRGVWRILNPLSAAYTVRAAVHGSFQGRTQGDATQQGGVLVILPPDRVVYRHISKVAGDNAPAGEVAAALERAVGAEHAAAPPA